MTEMQKRLAQEWVIDYNAQKAGERAGLTGGTNIRITAWQMLQHEDVQAYVQELQDAAALRAQISKDEWVEEWRKLGFSNIKNYMDNELNAKPLDYVKDPQAIKSIKKTVTEFEGGSKTQVEFTLHDKVAGLQNIGKHFGWYDADNKQKSATVQIMNIDPLSQVDDTTTNDSPSQNIVTP